MPTVSGLVSVRKPDGAPGAGVENASVFFQPLDAQVPPVDTTTNPNGRYSADLAEGFWLGAVSERNAGYSRVWLRFRVSDARVQTLNFFLDAPLTRLHGLVGAFPGELGLHAKRLDNGAEIAINADAPRYLASVAKVPIAVGCVDQMRAVEDMDDPVELSVYDHRDEGKVIAYEDLGAGWTVRSLMEAMIDRSDTTATDVLSAKYNIAEINKRLHRLANGFSQLSSMIELDRRRYWMGDGRSAALPAFALSLYRRHRVTAWIDQLGGTVPDRSELPTWDDYRADGWEQASPRVMGALLQAIATRTLFREQWKNALMLDTILAFRDSGRFLPSIDPTQVIHGKGGSHIGVTNEAGLVRDRSTRNPLATLVVFTERRDEGITGGQVGRIVAEAGELALRALDFELQLRPPNATSATPIVFLAPRPGLAFEQGDRPVIRWDSAGITGPLTLRLEDAEENEYAISANVTDDGEWHSYQFPDDLPSKDEYRFVLSGTDASGTTRTAESAWFSVGGSIHVTRPVAGEAFPPGSTPPIRWFSNGVTGDLTIRLLRNGRVIETFSRRARNDGEWHSWTIPDDLPRGKGYQIEVTSNDEPALTDRSPSFVVGGRIDVLFPAYGSVLDIGTTPTLRWRTENVKGPLRIELFGLGHTPLLSIATNARDDGEWHSWEVPDIADGDNYRIRVSERRNGDIEGYSGIFQLGTRFEWEVPSIDGAARGNNTLQARPYFVAYGETPTFRWRRIGAARGRLGIYLLRDNDQVQRFSDNAIDDGEWHSFTASSDLKASSRYSLVAFAKDKPTASGRSVHFSIGARVAVSVGVKRIGNGNTVTVRWQTEGLDNTALTLDLLDQAGTVRQNIGQTANGATQMVWNVATQASPARARVRATSQPEPDVEGFSEWFDLN